MHTQCIRYNVTNTIKYKLSDRRLKVSESRYFKHSSQRLYICTQYAHEKLEPILIFTIFAVYQWVFLHQMHNCWRHITTYLFIYLSPVLNTGANGTGEVFFYLLIDLIIVLVSNEPQRAITTASFAFRK